MNVVNCPNCGGRVKSESIGWKCEKCCGFIDMQGGFHEYIEKPFLPPLTYKNYIQTMNTKQLAEFLNSIAYARETPWSKPFDEKCCKKCPTIKGIVAGTGQEMEFNECDFADGECPHGDSIEWWLEQFIEEDDVCKEV